MSFSDEIQNEMNECREDERNSQNQIVQVIGTAGAMLGVIFTASIFQNESSSGVKLDPHMLLLLSIAIFSTAFLYITSLGIQNVLRYYYVQWLEDLLADPNESEVKMVHWMSFSSPVTTRNPLHLVNFYAIIHYLCYAGSVLAATSFCMLMIIYQYIRLGEKSDYERFGLIFVVIVIIICVAAFFVTSAKARDMFLYALERV